MYPVVLKSNQERQHMRKPVDIGREKSRQMKNKAVVNSRTNNGRVVGEFSTHLPQQNMN